MFIHRTACGCPFCVTWGRVSFFVTHQNRDPRLVEVATQRARIFYSQLVDLAEGFAPAIELAGHPRIPDPCLPPEAGVGGGKGVQPSVTPAAKTDEPVLTTTAKSKATPPREPSAPAPEVEGAPLELPTAGEASVRDGAPLELPKVGESEEEKVKKEKSPSPPSRSRNPEVKDKKRKDKDKTKKRSRQRSSRGSRKRDRKRSKRTSSGSRPEPKSSRRSCDKRPSSPERRRERKRKESSAAREERSPVARSSKVPEPLHPPSRGEGRRIPRPPSVPPPDRGRWEGPIRAYRGSQEGAWAYPEGGEYWPKSKGVKRREKNRAFREANYGRDWRRSERR